MQRERRINSKNQVKYFVRDLKELDELKSVGISENSVKENFTPNLVLAGSVYVEVSAHAATPPPPLYWDTSC